MYFDRKIRVNYIDINRLCLLIKLMEKIRDNYIDFFF
jgi:hypothetical protein